MIAQNTVLQCGLYRVEFKIKNEIEETARDRDGEGSILRL